MRVKILNLWLIGVLSLVLLTACGNEKKEVKRVEDAPPLTVKVHTLKKEAYPLWMTFSGKTQAVDEVNVLARVTGELKEQHFNPGDIVKKDQLLFTIDKSEYQAEWDQKNAILQKDKASLNLAKANVKRYTPLVREKLAPREKLDELLATQKQFEATVKADEAALKAALLNLEYCDVKASISGQIGKELVLTGNIVKAGTELTRIVQTGELYVNFNPTASEVAMIKKYRSQTKPRVKIAPNADERMDLSLEGEIDFIDNVSNTSTGTVAMRAKIFNKEQLIFPGTFVEVKLLITDKQPVLAIHPDQVYQDQQGQFIYVVNEKNELKTKRINPIFSNNDLVALYYEEHKDERVLVGTISGLRDGMKVDPVEVENPVKK